MPVKKVQPRILYPFSLSKCNASKFCSGYKYSVAHMLRLFLSLIQSRRQFRAVSCIRICHTYIYSVNSIGENVVCIQPFYLNLIKLNNNGYYVVIWVHTLRLLNIMYQITKLQQTDLKLTIVNCVHFFFYIVLNESKLFLYVGVNLMFLLFLDLMIIFSPPLFGGKKKKGSLISFLFVSFLPHRQFGTLNHRLCHQLTFISLSRFSKDCFVLWNTFHFPPSLANC